MTNQEKIIQLLHTTPKMTSMAIAECIGCQRTTAASRLASMFKNGKVLRSAPKNQANKEFIYYLPKSVNPKPVKLSLTEKSRLWLIERSTVTSQTLAEYLNGKTCNAVSILGDLEKKGVLERIGRNPATKQVTFRLKADDSKLQNAIKDLIKLQNDVTFMLNGLPESGYSQLQARQMLSNIRGKIEKIVGQNG